MSDLTPNETLDTAHVRFGAHQEGENVVRLGGAVPMTPEEPMIDDAGALLPQYMRDRQPLTAEQLDRLRSDVARPRYDSDDWLAGTHTRSMVRRLLATLDAARLTVVPDDKDEPPEGAVP